MTIRERGATSRPAKREKSCFSFLLAPLVVPGKAGEVVPSATRTQTTLAATVAGARHTPVSWTVLVECVSRAGDCCGEGGLGSSRRWHDHRPASRTGQGGSCLSSARNTRFLPLPRPGQLRVEGSLLRVEGGRPLPCLKRRRLDLPNQSRRSYLLSCSAYSYL